MPASTRSLKNAMDFSDLKENEQDPEKRGRQRKGINKLSSVKFELLREIK